MYKFILLVVALLISNILLSQPEVTRTRITLGGYSPKVYALIVGISDYKSNSIGDLKYCDDDAYLLYGHLNSVEGGAVPVEQIHLLIDENATHDNILNNLSRISKKVSNRDILIVYFAGHGVKGAFIPYNYNIKDKKVVKHSSVLSIINSSKAKHKLLIADACALGNWDPTTNDKRSINLIVEGYYNAFIQTSSSIAFLMATDKNGAAKEHNTLRQGVFSYFLLKGLKGAADYDRDKIVQIQELYNYIKVNVQEYTKGKQTPMLYGNYNNRMPLGMVRN